MAGNSVGGLPWMSGVARSRVSQARSKARTLVGDAKTSQISAEWALSPQSHGLVGCERSQSQDCPSIVVEKQYSIMSR